MEPLKLSESQAVVLASFCKGEFAHLGDARTVEEFERGIKACGNGLLRFVMQELSDDEDGGSVECGLDRVNAAVDELRNLADALASKVFDKAAG